MNCTTSARLVTLVIATGFGWRSAAALGQQIRIALDYNFNALVHTAGETGAANADDPDGLRSISDRALDLFAAGALGSSAIVGATGLNYTIQTVDHTLDVVHLGDRTLLWPFDSIPGNNFGSYPNWLVTADHNNNPQMTSITPPLTLDANTEIGILYQISNGGGQFEVTLGFSDASSVAVVLKGPDWFGTQAAWYTTNAPSLGVRSHAQLGTYPSRQNNDAAAATTATLNVVESIISVWKLDADGLGNVAGRELTSISFGNPLQAPGQRGYAILAATVDLNRPAPANNECGSATAIGNGAFGGSNEYATSAAASGCNPGDDRDVWFSYTVPAAHTRARASLCGSAFDTTLAIYDACGGNEIACNDDSMSCTNGNRSEVVWDVTPGSVWKIRIAGANGGRGIYSLTTSSSAPPANDECAGAQAIGNTTISLNTGTTLYGAGVGVPTTPCGGGSDTIDAWYSYTVPATAGVNRARASLCGSAIDTTVAVHDACGGTLVACNNDDGTCANGTRSDVVWPVTPSSVWKIRVAGANGARGAISMTTSSGVGPFHDDCAGATPIGETTVTSTTVFATGASTSGCGGGNDTADVWYVYTPSAGGQARASLCASNFNTTLAVYDACGGNELMCNDDSANCANANRSEVVWSITPGTPYYLRIAGVNGARGTTASLTVALLPANDDCGGCTAVAEGVFTGGTAAATGTDVSLCATNDTKDVWYCYTASQNGVATVSLCGSGFDTTITVFDTCGGNQLACDDDSMIGTCSPTATTTQSWAAFPTAANTTYLVRVAGYNGASGNYTLTIAAETPPGNDLCADCTPMAEETLTGSSLFATGSDVSSCVTDDVYDVWFCYTASRSGTARAALCGSAFNTSLAIYDACGGNELACNDNDAVCGTGSTQSSVSWSTGENSVYYIRISGAAGGFVGSAAGAYTLTVSNPGNVSCGPIVNPGNGHTYYLLYPGSWTDAEAQAVALGGHLATIDDAAENEWVRTNVLLCNAADRRGWIGLSDAASEGDFVWSSGHPVGFVNWNAGEPNNANGAEHYVELLGGSGLWNDLPDAGAAAGDWGIVEVVTATCPGLRADTNCDQNVDFFDIDPFLLALFDLPTYQATYCGGDICAADVDGSESIDFFDIDPFLACLFGTCP